MRSWPEKVISQRSCVREARVAYTRALVDRQLVVIVIKAT